MNTKRTPRLRSAPPAANPAWAYFLDLDGTLIHLADTPQAVLVDQSLLELITRLLSATDGAVALVSGRMISDMQGRIDLPKLAMAGLHGLERRDSDGRLWIHAAPPATKSAIKDALASLMARHPGLLLEDKGLTLALHYRLAPRMAGTVHRLMARFANAPGQALELQRGKCVVEIKPAGIDKGTAVFEYLAEFPFKGRHPVFIGDDANDERGLAAVNQVNGISIKVGKGVSCARFRLPDVDAVHRWLGAAMKE